MTLARVSAWEWMKAANSSGVLLLAGSMPAVSSFSRTSGSASTFFDRSVQLGHDIARRARGRDDALPDAEIVSGIGLGDGRNVRGERKALRAHQAEDLDLPVAPKRQRHVDAFHAQRNVAGENAGDLGRPAAIGNHGEIGPCHHVEKPDIDLRRRRADPDLEGPGLR